LLILLFVLWLIFNGKVTLEIVLIGMALSVLTFQLCCGLLGTSWKKEILVYRAVPLYAAWFVLLIWEVIKANWAVIKIILNPRIPVRQSLVTIRTDLKTDIARAMLADSITLTPGTITVQAADDGTFTVHCLSDDMLDGVQETRLMKVIRKVEALYAGNV